MPFGGEMRRGTSRAPGRLLRRLSAIGLVVAGAFAAASSLTTAPGCSSDPPKQASGEPITIGVSLGLSNALAGTSAPLRDAIRVAEGQINANGGVLGKPIFFDIQDDQSEPDKAVKVAQSFVQKRYPAVIGPVGSGQVVKVAEIYAQAQMVEISPTATSVDLTNIQPTSDRWFFRTTPADDFQGAAVLRFTQLTPSGLVDGGASGGDGGAPSKCSKLVIVNINNAYGNSMAKVISDNFKRVSGSSVLLTEVISDSLENDYAAQLNRIFPLNPDCMALIAYEDTGAQFVSEMKADPRFTALEAKRFFIIGTDGIFTDGFLERSRQDKSNPKSQSSAVGVYGTNPDTQPGTKEYNEFRTFYAAGFPLPSGQDAPAFTANAYDAAILIALAIQRTGNTTDRAALRDNLREVSGRPGTPFTPAQIGAALAAAREGTDIDYKGASGAVDLEPNGNVKSGFIIWKAVRLPDETVGYKTEGRFTLEELVGTIQ
ncbi:MAG: ABC transporter substrate-binding protein [Deltaproteobacteria bacterium]|nr:ABC transporter substrate-binding protein [Deltaproteobacteria bacterium]